MRPLFFCLAAAGTIAWVDRFASLAYTAREGRRGHGRIPAA